MELLWLLLSALLGLVVLAYFTLWRQHGSAAPSNAGRVLLLFIDAPDPDNPAAAVALWRHVLLRGRSGRRLHVVLTGRQLNLRTAKNVDGGVSLEEIRRQKWETHSEHHAQRVLEDSARRLSNYLVRCGVPVGEFTLYHGGVAAKAPLSDVMHDWDFLFDRKDLLSGHSADEGEILTPGEYQQLVGRYSSMTEDDRERSLLATLRCYDLVPLDRLQSLLQQSSCGGVSIFLGGPATALVKLFKMDASLCDKVSTFHAMFASTGSATLLPNQFNIECDIEAATELLINGLFPGIPKFLITTETSKLPALVLSSNEMEEKGINPYVVKLHRLWESTHGDRPQPIFDVLPVMCSLGEYKDYFRWSAKKAILQEWSTKDGSIKALFSFADTDNSTVLVSEASFGADRELFLEFLRKTF